MKYRKKPVVIEAFQWTGQPKDEMPQWFQERWDDIGHTILHGSAFMVIPTLEGDHRAGFGEWIIKGIKDELYPCKPDIFAATYEPVE